MSVCVSKATLSAMALGPVLPAYGFLCNPYLGNVQGTATGDAATCQPGVPCCAGVPLSIFNPLPYPIAVGSAQLIINSTNPITGPANAVSITNDLDLQNYLNAEVLPLLIAAAISIEGTGSQWSITNGTVLSPKINGTCDMLMSPVINLAPLENRIPKPTKPTDASSDSRVLKNTIEESKQNHDASIPVDMVTTVDVVSNHSKKASGNKGK